MNFLLSTDGSWWKSGKWRWKPESTRNKLLCLSAGHLHSGHESLCTQYITYSDPSHAAKICQGLDLTRLPIRYKTMLFLSEYSGIKLKQPIYSNIPSENTCIVGFSPKTEWKNVQKHQLLLFLHRFFIILLRCPNELPQSLPLPQGRCAVNSVQDVKNSLQDHETLSRAFPLIFSCFIAFTEASAKTEHKTPFSAHRGNRTYFIPQSFCNMDNTQKHWSSFSQMKYVCPYKQPWSGMRSMSRRGSNGPSSSPIPQAQDAPCASQRYRAEALPSPLYFDCQSRQEKCTTIKYVQIPHLQGFRLSHCFLHWTLDLVLFLVNSYFFAKNTPNKQTKSLAKFSSF